MNDIIINQQAYEGARKLYLYTDSMEVRNIAEKAMIILLRRGVQPCR